MSTTSAYEHFSRLNLVPAEESYFTDWSASESEEIHLDDAFIARQADYLALPQAMLTACQKTAQNISADVQRIMAHSIYRMKQRELDNYLFPTSPKEDNDLDPLLNVILYMQLVEHLRAQHEKMGITEDITRDTLSDLFIWIDDYYQKEGVYGFAQAGWLKNHFCAKLFRIGRLQFEKSKVWDFIRVYKHKSEPNVLIATTEDQQFCTDGLYATANSNGIHRSSQTTWVEEGDVITATCFDPSTGLAEEAPRAFSLDEYELVVQQNDPVLSVHIAASGPMKRDDCLESMARAFPFYEKHVPEFKPKALWCSSWLLNAHFREYLKPDANIVQFMELWNKFPRTKSNGHAFFDRVWGREDVDIETAEQKSSLQKAIIQHLKNGGRWNDMGGIILPEHIPALQSS